MDKLSSKIFVKFTVFLPPGIFHNFFTGMRPRLFCIFHIFNISLWKIFLASHPAAFKYCSLLSKKSQKSTYFCKKDKKVSDTGREGGGEDRVSR